MQSLTRNQQPPNGKTSRTEIFEMMEAVEKMHRSFFAFVAGDVVAISLRKEPYH